MSVMSKFFLRLFTLFLVLSHCHFSFAAGTYLEATPATPATIHIKQVWSSASKVAPIKPESLTSETQQEPDDYNAENFVVKYDPQISSQMKEMWAKTLGQHDPAIGARIRSINALQGFEQEAVKFGLTIHDLGDVFTAYWVVAWQIVHKKPDPSKRQILAARKQIRQIIAANPSLLNLQGATRQQMAEMMIYQMLIFAAAYEEGKTTGNQAGLRMLSNIMNNLMIGNGFNMRNYKLTNGGFVAMVQ